MRRKLKIIVGALAAGIIGLMIYAPFSPGGRQRSNMALAEKHIQAHAGIVRAEPRFNEVLVGVGTAGDGCVFIYGAVASEGDLLKLKQTWASTHPPVKTIYSVRVFPEPDFSEVKKFPQTSPQSSDSK